MTPATNAVPEHMHSDVQRLVKLYESMADEEAKRGAPVYTSLAWQRMARDAVKILRDLLDTDPPQPNERRAAEKE